MPDFLLRNIDPKLWAKVKAIAAKERRTLRAVLLQLLEAYASSK